MSAAKVTSAKDGDTLKVSVSGYVGENAGLFDLNFSGVKKVVVDLAGVNYINSVGVKNWINWTGRFPKELRVEFANCPALIINQVNMVAGFLPANGWVESLYAPFVCEDCNREETSLLMRGRHFDYAQAGVSYKVSPPEVPCGKCKKPMQMDVIELKFFNFLKKIWA